ncbi:probable 3',5'-cyclic phosphodiesterase pde-5 isoform X2 [Physella acuta]|uniref:probable 3',5'-cyclic phosphodiesterase pde-5 isoform X2 n=1 Tax=Physella acuta TaxID=109671 RepID=UPI0027DAD9BB|nr:probable 3',5'-cyclic phosphodiesterase pde-5 isoform X2 [Physella acuta]
MPFSSKFGVMPATSGPPPLRSPIQRRLPPLKQQTQPANNSYHNVPSSSHSILPPGSFAITNGNALVVSGVMTEKPSPTGNHGRNGLAYTNGVKTNNGSPYPLNNGVANTLGYLSITPVPAAHTAASPIDTTSTVSVSRLVGRRPSPMGRNKNKTLSKPGLQGVTTDTASTDLSPELVTQYLRQNPDVLDQYISNHVTTDRIERWLQVRPMQSISHALNSLTSTAVNGGHTGHDLEKSPLSKWKIRLQTSKGRVLQELSKEFHHTNGRVMVLLELAACVASAIGSDTYTLYSCDPDRKEISRLSRTENGDVTIGAKEKLSLGYSAAATVALSKEPTRLHRLQGDASYPEGLSVTDKTAECAMVLPILNEAETCFGVVEFYRQTAGSQFTEEEEEVATLMFQWYDMLVDYVETHSVMIRQRKLSDFLLEVTKSVFQDIVSMDVVIMKIMNFAQRLVNADRASLFLVDYYKRELYARIFDVGQPSGSTASDQPDARPKPQDEIRFPMEKGVAGYVASTGKILNIKDAYKDPRFNPDVDIRTGYKTKTILCMPIFIRGVVIGVVQMVNKRNGTFTKSDEQAFETFAIYCGLALHHAKLYEKIRRSEQKYKVALDVLSYHSQATPEEVANLKAKPIPAVIRNITKYEFSPWAVTDDEKPLHCLYMFRILFADIKFDLEDLMRFTLTVKKNYRHVPYHNWHHAFSVAHSMFTVLQTTQHKLAPVECIGLFVSCLCHDLDHRGKTNQFMVQSCSPLAAVYSTSTMEHHHFNQTVTILQNEGHNIFKYLSSDEYKKVLGDIKQSILATDLAMFFKNKVILANILKTEPFNWDTMHHRSVLTAVAMTACDLCAMFKPWDVQLSLVYIIMEEFWQQGDEEKKRGITPMQMMDRDKKEELPKLEVGFIQSICIPCYELMKNVLPETKPMLDGSIKNMKRWQELCDQQLKQAGTNV